MIQCLAWIAMIRADVYLFNYFLQRLQISSKTSFSDRDGSRNFFIVDCIYSLVLNNSNFRRYIILLKSFASALVPKIVSFTLEQALLLCTTTIFKYRPGHIQISTTIFKYRLSRIHYPISYSLLIFKYPQELNIRLSL